MLAGQSRRGRAGHASGHSCRAGFRDYSGLRSDGWLHPRWAHVAGVVSFLPIFTNAASNTLMPEQQTASLFITWLTALSCMYVCAMPPVKRTENATRSVRHAPSAVCRGSVSDVIEHSELDLDILDMETSVDLLTTAGMAAAYTAYSVGGNR